MAPVKKRDVRSSFIKDTAQHEMTVKHESGVYRHLLFKMKDQGQYWFEIITWPGSLTINGDMGCWTFSRISDMLTFFRRDDLSINDGYWSEKLMAESKYEGPAHQFCIDTVKDSIDSYLKEVFKGDEEEWSLEKQAALWSEIEDDILKCESRDSVCHAISDFEHEGFRFEDWYDYIRCTDWSYHFLWNLYAIVWGIIQYDNYKMREKAA